MRHGEREIRRFAVHRSLRRPQELIWGSKADRDYEYIYENILFTRTWYRTSVHPSSSTTSSGFHVSILKQSPNAPHQHPWEFDIAHKIPCVEIQARYNGGAAISHSHQDILSSHRSSFVKLQAHRSRSIFFIPSASNLQLKRPNQFQHHYSYT